MPYYPLTCDSMTDSGAETLMDHIERDPECVLSPIHDGTFCGASMFEWVIGKRETVCERTQRVTERIFELGLRLDGASTYNPRTRAMPLHVAAIHGRLEMFCRLLHACPELASVCGPMGGTPLVLLLHSRGTVAKAAEDPAFYLALAEAAPECFGMGDVILLLHLAVARMRIPSTKVVQVFLDAAAAVPGAHVTFSTIDEVAGRLFADLMGAKAEAVRRPEEFCERLRVLRMLVEAYPQSLNAAGRHSAPIKTLLRAASGVQEAGEAVEDEYCKTIRRMAELCPDATLADAAYDCSALAYVCRFGSLGLGRHAVGLAAVLLTVAPQVLGDDEPLLERLRDTFPPAELASAIAAYSATRRSDATRLWESNRRASTARYIAWKEAAAVSTE